MKALHLKFIIVYSFMHVCTGVVSMGHAMSFSFDQLYPTTASSRALNALRYAYSLAQDIHDNQYDADRVRHVWLEVYGACDQLCSQNNTGRVLTQAGSVSMTAPDDLKAYIQDMWQVTCQTYDQVIFKDVSLGQFINHMRIACNQLIRKL